MTSAMNSLLKPLRFALLCMLLTVAEPIWASSGISEKLATGLANILKDMNVYDQIKPMITSISAKPDLKAVTIHDTTYPVLKFLGSGMTGNAYLVKMDNRAVVVKISHNNQRSINDVFTTVLTLQVAREKFGIPVPGLIDYDSSGKWIISEFVSGKTVKKTLQQKGKLSQVELESLRELHEKVLRYDQEQGKIIDLAPDNIILKDGRAILVDAGTLPMGSVANPKQFNELIAKWNKSSGAVGGFCRQVFL